MNRQIITSFGVQGPRAPWSSEERVSTSHDEAPKSHRPQPYRHEDHANLTPLGTHGYERPICPGRRRPTSSELAISVGVPNAQAEKTRRLRGSAGEALIRGASAATANMI